jgi:NAD(P)-dependent dehydrogenase (short-subunit alcohol dehydrogenase family)
MKVPPPQRCFICKKPFEKAHSFYRGLCGSCGDLSWKKRHDKADLMGRVALVTGARTGIGRATALRLLRNGATVLATTRFPRNAAQSFAQEADFNSWSNRLQIRVLDLKQLVATETFALKLAQQKRLDILINNAAQTVRRAPDFYAPLIEAEARAALSSSAENLLDTSSMQPAWDENLSDIEYSNAQFGGVETPHLNSWMMRDEEVSVLELMEVHVINALAPFVLTSRLKPLLARSEGSFVVNVSSSEGRFAGSRKACRHPHTNMAKASMNMMTRTVAEDYARHKIYVNSVDPGWISFQHPTVQTEAMQARGVVPPFDGEDAAARVCDPIFMALNGTAPARGELFKDYEAVTW